MKTIAVEDCYKLKKEFRKYCETAEPHEFVALLLVDAKLESSVAKFAEESKNGEVIDQKTANTMFRVVLKLMGRDYSEYTECEPDNKRRCYDCENCFKCLNVLHSFVPSLFAAHPISL